MQPQVVPPERHYFAFSIDVAATLELYCDGGNDSMLRKLDGVKDRMYAGYCLMVDGRVDEDNKYHVIDIRPVQQGLTKAHPRKPQHARPTMCIPILPETAHPRSREPLELSGALPWDNCYHPTCYDVCARVLTEWRDYSQSPCVMLSAPLVKAIPEDIRYGRLLRAGVDDDQALRILDGQQDTPEIDFPDDMSETDSQTCKTFLAKIPGSDKPEEDATFVPVMRIDHVLSNVPEISDPAQLCGDLELFQEIVQEYQLARYGSILFEPPEGPPIDDTPIPDNFSMVYSIMSTASRTSTEGNLESDPSGSHGPDPSLLDSEEVSPASASSRKGKWGIKSLFRRAITRFVGALKWRKFSNKS
ncbi:hypothetical protein EV421DRAFT_2036136 [Armillaria borealis]|uniref:Uncharacterized protein n=1 Tax=Armillaria borealis TaxID=47425 RepID=A0AA39JFR2_9AGAR|nr:hypothetical protein EV421DRAFT_2036136 [Armillaria borealis]